MRTAASTENFITIDAPDHLSLPRQIDAVSQRYAEALQSLNLSPDSAVFRRIYVSDAANQAGTVRESSLFTEPLGSAVAVSLVQQPPLRGGKIALFAYHLEAPSGLRKKHVAPGHVLVENGDLKHLWSTRLCTVNTDQPSDAVAQTRDVFDRLINVLGMHDSTLKDNCVRTWLYVKDVDVFYQDVVDSRTAVFNEQGLTRDTHYIASTGIEGTCSHRYDVVLMDAYSVVGLQPRQVMYLNDFSRLCHTKDYNVTFERGT